MRLGCPVGRMTWQKACRPKFQGGTIFLDGWNAGSRQIFTWVACIPPVSRFGGTSSGLELAPLCCGIGHRSPVKLQKLQPLLSTAMHKAFSVNDIIRLIADSVPYGELKSAVALACCCRSISALALDSLWRKQTDLVTLFVSTLPPSTWKIVNHDFVGFPSRRITKQHNCLLQPRILSWNPLKSNGTGFLPTLVGCGRSPSRSHSFLPKMPSNSSAAGSRQSPCYRFSGR